MKFKSIFILICSAWLWTGCNEYLNLVPEDDILTIPKIFETRTGAEQWMIDANQGFVPLQVYTTTNPAFCGADEYISNRYARENRGMTSFLIADGLQTALAPINDMWTYNGVYYYIRYCNTFLKHIGDVYNLNEGELETWTAEIKALKAFYYFELVKRYGPIVLVPQNIDVYAPMEEQRQPRSPLDSCFKAINQLLDEAIPYLQVFAEKDATRRMFFSKEGAMGLKCRVLLYAASPLFNGGISVYKDLKNKNGELLFPVEDKEKWRVAAEYLDETIQFLEGHGYKLIAGTQEKSTPLLNTMRDLECSLWAPNFQNSTEAVMMVSGFSDLFQRILPQLGTKTTDPHYSSVLDGSIGTNIRMVRKFYTANGLPIEEDRTWTYGDGYGMAQERDVMYTSVVPMGTDVLALHLKREPRFYAMIAAPGLYWQLGKSVNYNLIVDSYQGGLFGLKQDRLYPNYAQNITGYFVKKGTRSDFNLKTYSQDIMSFAVNVSVTMRLAELYLAVAEAWNEYEGPNGAHRDQIFDRLNAVRERAGIPTVQDSWGRYGVNANKFNEQAGLRSIIQRERTIELMFEGHRFWDVRRWGTAITEGWNDKPMGWNVLGKNWQAFYNNGQGPMVVWDQAQFIPARDYLFPIKSEEVMISGIVQNPGW
ncbi:MULTISPECIES: RagB/SusD family nutrient uptake outer membrane protein [Butyricimonas]|uniref:RagB/SusD family nutrient uptake outer membrane protein n=1 Tax=Butyricimonas hominis TaxID=2763032 RepID=A0ABR7CW58_9BACT|nr:MULTISPECIES: RagB/SusD family nutrient uptake outer membrane protein [Butyricimonas]MBC5619911.1 RagB/SusD family nutrient uptake outer membrane protein [Butyricimonas hominis]MCB6973471.1 RagB/SusD family nutrient uptake outer membrane protein [Butyricimonas synergistica]MCG4520425.1 RagB/SusD family nutrient uptake outer membrane protein [Butyricimonas sp. DFI.6.44]